MEKLTKTALQSIFGGSGSEAQSEDPGADIDTVLLNDFL